MPNFTIKYGSREIVKKMSEELLDFLMHPERILDSIEIFQNLKNTDFFRFRKIITRFFKASRKNS